MKIFNKKNYSILLSLIILSFIGYVSYQAYNYSITYDLEMSKQAEENKVKKYTDSSVKDVVRIGFGKLNDYVFKHKETKEKKQKNIQKTQENKEIMEKYVMYYFVLVSL